MLNYGMHEEFLHLNLPISDRRVGVSLHNQVRAILAAGLQLLPQQHL